MVENIVINWNETIKLRKNTQIYSLTKNDKTDIVPEINCTLKYNVCNSCYIPINMKQITT